MTDFLEKELFPLLESGKTLVFATEESARAVSVEYILKTKKSILSSQCISFDTFASKIFEIPEGCSAIDEFGRMLFSSWFIEKHSSSLKFFYNSKYPEMKDGLASFISSMLPDLEEAFEDGVSIAKNVSDDLCLLEREYISFLNKCNLYEMHYVSARKELDLSDYYLVSPSAFPKEVKLLRRASSLKFNTIEADEFDAHLSVYEIEKEELRSTFVQIRKLLDEGTALNDIAISSSGLDRLTPYIKLEAKLFDIPLNFVAGSKIPDTLPGKFLSELYVLYSEKFRISDMKAFLLNPSMPFVDIEKNRAFIADAINQSVTFADDDWNKDRFIKIAPDDGFGYFTFRKYLTSLMTATDSFKCQNYFQMLLDFLFGEDRFADSDEDNNVFGHIQSELKKFLYKVKSFEECGFKLKQPLFPIFVQLMSKSIYSPKEKPKGVNVYPFSQAAATPYKHHFLITLNDSESKSLVKDANFLSEFERAKLEDVDVTENLLKVYFSFSENVYLSTSRETYSGQMLPVVALLRKQKNARYDGEDSYIVEASNERKKCQIYSLQQKGYERAKVISLSGYKFENMEGEKEEIPSLSFSTVESYIECHFKYALKKKFALDKEALYDIADYNALLIGTRIHSVMERFYRETHGQDESKLGAFFDEEMNLWMEGQEYKYDRNTKKEDTVNLPPGSMVPNKFMVQYIRAKYFDNMELWIKKINEKTNYFPDGEELWLDRVFPELGFRLRGMVDKIGKSKDSGNFIVYDYKTGSPKNYGLDKMLQFYIYSLLIEAEFGESVDEGTFAFLSESPKVEKNGEIKGSWKNKEEDNNIYLKILMDVSSLMRDGNWNKIDDTKVCSGCEFKGICRRRMVIK